MVNTTEAPVSSAAYAGSVPVSSETIRKPMFDNPPNYSIESSFQVPKRPAMCMHYMGMRLPQIEGAQINQVDFLGAVLISH